ncbi:unnamed protein product, partial [Effrenium voratum]
DAMEVMDDAKNLELAVADLRKGFSSNSSRAAKASRRKEVLAMAKKFCGSRPIFPLQENTVVSVAAALSTSGFRSVMMYVAELKQLHVEKKFPVEEWFVKLLTDIKRSATRGLGPANRAPLIDVKAVKSHFGFVDDREVALKNPAEVLMVAMKWLLREVEVAALTLGNAVVDLEAGTATLFLPVSKTDAGGSGVARTLKCSCGRGVKEECPVHTLETLVRTGEVLFKVDRRSKEAWDIPLCCNQDLVTPPKNQVVEAWSFVAGCRVTGHSARRSGAVEYVRKGLPLQALSFLGRWKSGVVLNYAEEALQEVPIETHLPIQPEEVVVNYEKEEVKEVVTVKDPQELKPKWIKRRVAGAVVHKVGTISVRIPSTAWQTVCGWRFNQVEFSIVEDPTKEFRMCAKCVKILKNWTE